MTEQELQQIEAAKAALDKATPGPWEMGENVRGFYHIWGKKHEWVGQIHALPEKSHNDATLIAAAPALVRRVQELEDWQAQALPWLRGYKKFVSGERITHLSALIEQAEGGK